jgi:hypothetical protein
MTKEFFRRKRNHTDSLVIFPVRFLIDRQEVQPQFDVHAVRNSAARGEGLACVIAGICLLLSGRATGHAQARLATGSSVQKETIVREHASGTFEVKLTPQKPDNKEAEAANLGRMSIDKQFHGDLEAASKGEMLSVVTEVKGSAGYVAMERVRGSLRGKSGTFVLQHTATMARGEPQLSIGVVPDSGTGQLVGLSGTMSIKIVDGKHFYEFDYTLPETR